MGNYAGGLAAKVGDFVQGKPAHTTLPIAGRIVALVENATDHNCQVAWVSLIPGAEADRDRSLGHRMGFDFRPTNHQPNDPLPQLSIRHDIAQTGDLTLLIPAVTATPAQAASAAPAPAEPATAGAKDS